MRALPFEAPSSNWKARTNGAAESLASVRGGAAESLASKFDGAAGSHAAISGGTARDAAEAGPCPSAYLIRIASLGSSSDDDPPVSPSFRTKTCIMAECEAG